MSAELENVCTPCAKRHDSEPREYPATKWMAVCDLCNQFRVCAAPRDFAPRVKR